MGGWRAAATMARSSFGRKRAPARRWFSRMAVRSLRSRLWRTVGLPAAAATARSSSGRRMAAASRRSSAWRADRLAGGSVGRSAGQRRRRRHDQTLAQGGQRRAGDPRGMAARSFRWRRWRTVGWRAPAETVRSSSGPGTFVARRRCSCMAARSGRWRCWRTGGWPAPATTARSSSGRGKVWASR